MTIKENRMNLKFALIVGILVFCLIGMVSAAPSINFTAPTPANGTSQTTTSVYVNVSSNSSLDHSVFLDWNRSLIGWWAMDFYNASGIYDNSTWNNFGTFAGQTSVVNNGRRGKAALFDGFNDYIDMGDGNNNILNSPNRTNQITLIAWVNATQFNWGDAIVGKSSPNNDERAYALAVYGPGSPVYVGAYIYFSLSCNGTSWTEIGFSDLTFDANQTVQIAVVSNGTTMMAYLNGVKSSTEVNAPPLVYVILALLRE